MLKERLNGMNEQKVRSIVKRRLNRHCNKVMADHMNLCEANLEQLDANKKALFLANKKNEPDKLKYSKVPWELGYSQGLIYARKLMEEGRYTQEALLELARLLPNSYACICYNKSFGKGFIEGLLGGDDTIETYEEKPHDTNRHTLKWRESLEREFSRAAS